MIGAPNLSNAMMFVLVVGLAVGLFVLEPHTAKNCFVRIFVLPNPTAYHV